MPGLILRLPLVASNALVVCIELRITYLVRTGSDSDRVLISQKNYCLPSQRRTQSLSLPVPTFGGEMDYKHRGKMLVKGFFEKSFWDGRKLSEMTVPFRLQNLRFAFNDKLNYSSICGDLADCEESAEFFARNFFFVRSKKKLEILATV
jgi:hypothetical protein